MQGAPDIVGRLTETGNLTYMAIGLYIIESMSSFLEPHHREVVDGREDRQTN